MIDWLVHTLFATSALMAIVLLVRGPVRRQLGAAAAYGLWLIPALRLLMPPLTVTVERVVPALAPRSVALSSAQATLVPVAQRGWENIAVSVWLVGAAAVLVCGILIYRRQRREVLRDSVELARLGKIRLVRSRAVRGPMAFGIFDRVVAVPVDFEERFSPEERTLAVDHEVAHHRSGDVVLSHFAFAVLGLQWFNPLAWLSHAAFRFDQEAACDARVLDNASKEQRAAYGQAIAKAASGRALLFSGALDRPRTLHRRLAAMLSRPSTRRRFAGKTLIALAAAAALPLTASHAVEYADAKPARAPVVAATPAPVAAGGDLPYPDLGGVILDKDSVAFMADDTVLIGGKRKRLEQLDAGERARLRKAIHRSQHDLTHERARLPRELAEAKREADRARSGELRREHMQNIKDLRRDLAEVASLAAELRAGGEDPAKRKAEILRDLRDAEAEDIAREEREAIEEADPNRRLEELRRDEEQMVRILSKLDQLERR